MILKRSVKGLKRSPLKKRGVTSKAWETFRNQYAEECRNEEGLIRTEPTKVGLPEEYLSVESPDLHHIIGRSERPDLMFDKSNLVWLSREQHQKVHNHEVDN